MSAPVTDELIGRTLDKRYLVRRLIGRGGMGAVYEADHIGLDRRVAIKFLLGGRSDADMLARFNREARAASKVEHEHVVQIYDVGTDDSGVDFIAMEYIEGSSLEKVLRDGPIEPARAVHIGKQLLTGLQAIHDGGILHRDIKPGNIQLTEHDGDPDFVKIMDFGISKVTDSTSPAITHSGHVVGTPQYMSPEQLAGLDVDHRSDLYAAALTLYEMIVGAAPFTGGNTYQLVAMHLSQEPRPIEQLVPKIPAGVARAIHRGLEKSPPARFASATEFVAALGGSMPSTGQRVASVSATPPSSSGDHREAATVAAKRAPRETPAPPQATTAVDPIPRSRWPLVIAGLLVLGVPLGVFFAMRKPGAKAAAPSATIARDAATDPPAVDGSPASQHLVYARDAEQAGKLELAIAGYEAAYAAQPDSALLVQIAGLYDKLGKPSDALTAYRRYIEAAPTASDAAQVRVRIDELTPRPTKAQVAKTRKPPSTTNTSMTSTSTSASTTRGMTCRCWQTPDLDVVLCKSIDDGLVCRCEMGQAPLCASKPAHGSCPNTYPLSASQKGQACKGFLGAHTQSELLGFVRCRFCPAAEQRRGQPTEACVGYHPTTGDKSAGILDSCIAD